MSYLAIERLENNVPVSQKIRLTKAINLDTVRIGLYKAGVVTDGTLTLAIYQDDVFITTKTLNCTDLNQTGTNFHGMIAFYLDNALAIRKAATSEYTELTFEFTLLGNTDLISEIGLVRNSSPTQQLYNTNLNPYLGDEALTVWYNPFNIELYSG